MALIGVHALIVLREKVIFCKHLREKLVVFQVPKAGAGTPASVYPHCLEDGNGWSRSVVSPVPKSEGPGPPARVSAAAAGGAKRRAFTDAGAKGTARQREKGPIHPDPLFSTRLRR